MHQPVLLNDMLACLNVSKGKIYLDATFGGGGYSQAILEQGGQVIAIDRDQDAIDRAKHLGISCFHMTFSELESIFPDTLFDGIVFDFGVSSFQIDEAERGFSFQKDGPLDMRMGKSTISAKDVVNDLKEKDLADLIFSYGDEPRSRSIAHAICTHRQQKPFTSTLQLAQVIRSVVPSKPGFDGATLTFQAIRMYVNDELREIHHGLTYAMSHLSPLGRLVCVSFHSLEDRLVKNALKASPLTLFNKKVIIPSNAEIHANPRSRSARLRCACNNLENQHIKKFEK